MALHKKKQPTNSFLAAFLSLLLPGLGQVYLRTPAKGFLYFLGVSLGALLVYLNSLPLTSWRDLIRFDEAQTIIESQKNEEGFNIDLDKLKQTAEGIEQKPHQELFEHEEQKLMYKPNWIIKITGFLQVVLIWVWSISDGWSGERGTNMTAFKRRLKAQDERYHKDQKEQ